MDEYGKEVPANQGNESRQQSERETHSSAVAYLGDKQRQQDNARNQHGAAHGKQRTHAAAPYPEHGGHQREQRPHESRNGPLPIGHGCISCSTASQSKAGAP